MSSLSPLATWRTDPSGRFAHNGLPMAGDRKLFR